MKRLFDLVLAFVLVMIFLPFFLVIACLVWIGDFRSPFYVATRVAKDYGTFRMIKFRSMIVNAAKTGVNSSSADDKRITAVGRFIRRYKIDELPQLFNVLKGEMSFVGPRPQVQVDADLYTDEERRILTVRPGITDLASIVFADEGDILKGAPDPDLRYNQVIRPWKSRLALIYIDRADVLLDARIIWFTFLNLFNRGAALERIRELLRQWNSDRMLIQVVQRENELLPYPPPGSDQVVMSYPK